MTSASEQRCDPFIGEPAALYMGVGDSWKGLFPDSPFILY
jgi:hypothetical protein